MNSPINLSSPIQFSDPLPTQADVVIVGGGVIGISTALALADRGVSVLVCDKGRVAAEQSSRNWGWVRQTGRDAAELPIVMESVRLWQEMAARTGENSLLFNRGGVLYLADSESDLADYEDFVQIAKAHGLDSRILSGQEVARKIPHASRRWKGALYTESDGRVEPWLAVPAMARAAQRAGVQIIEHCAVRALDTQAGSLSGVMTEQGPVATTRVLIAGGAWSSLLARQSGVYLPQLAVKGTVARVECPVPLFSGNAADSGLAFAARADGGYSVALDDHHDFFIGPDAVRFFKPFLQAVRHKGADNRYHLAAPAGYPDAWGTTRRWAADSVSPFERCRVADPQASPKLVRRMLARLQQRFAECGNARATHVWAGMIDTTPDFVPVMDQVASLPGLAIATGFSGHGFGIGPGAGRVMADVLQGRDPAHDLSRFRLSRFSDGSRLQLGPM